MHVRVRGGAKRPDLLARILSANGVLRVQGLARASARVFMQSDRMFSGYGRWLYLQSHR